MADRRRSDALRPDGHRGLAARLRREARAGRPAFSVGLHERVSAAVAEASPTPGRPGRRGRPWAIGVAGGLVAVAVVAALVGGWRWPAAESPLSPVDAVAVGDVPGIERLPTPGEIGADVLAEVTTLAVVAMGMPELTDLAAFDPAVFASTDDAGR